LHLCLACEKAFESNDWRCPHCGVEPHMIDGVAAFAPDLARSNSGLGPEDHHVLDLLQHGSFWFRARNKLLQDFTKKWFSSADSVLEIGCGTGYVLAALYESLPHARFVGSEIYANGLHYAAKRLSGRAELLQMDARAIPFIEEFDMIAACDVLEHIDDDNLVLSRMHSALKPGGGVLLTVPQHPFLWSRSDEIACHKRRYRQDELAQKCKVAGFRVVAQSSFVTTLMPLMLAQRLTSGRHDDYDPAAALALPPWQDRLLEKALDFERMLILWGVSLPFGGSRIVVAMRD
jgi:SAM-dependent methyltransferase